MIHVIASISVKPGKMEEFLKLFKANVPAVLAEDGCIRYEPCLDVNTGFEQGPDENKMTVVESWASLEHLKAHLKTPHMVAFGAAAAHLRDGVALTVVEPA